MASSDFQKWQDSEYFWGGYFRWWARQPDGHLHRDREQQGDEGRLHRPLDSELEEQWAECGVQQTERLLISIINILSHHPVDIGLNKWDYSNTKSYQSNGEDSRLKVRNDNDSEHNVRFYNFSMRPTLHNHCSILKIPSKCDSWTFPEILRLPNDAKIRDIHNCVYDGLLLPHLLAGHCEVEHLLFPRN